MVASMWLLIGFLLLVFELLAPAMIIIFFGVSAFVMAGILLINPDISIGTQLIIYGLISISSLLILRKKLKSLSESNINKKIDSSIDFNKNINQYATVLTEFNELNSLGRVKINGVEWNAKSTDNETFDINERAEVIGNDGITVLIKKVNQQEKTNGN